MASLSIHNIGDDVVSALKIRARQHGVTMEIEHRRILEDALVKARPKRNFASMLIQIPNVGHDADFERRQDDGDKPVFD